MYQKLRTILATHTEMETTRLKLRPVMMADAQDMYEYASDKEVTRFTFDPHTSLDDTRDNIANYFMASPLGKWAIEDKQSGKMIGTIDLMLDSINQTAEIGYTLNQSFWGQGLAPEASRAVLELAFQEMALNRVCAFHDERNPKSGRVMEKIGLKKEGFFPNKTMHRGKPANIVGYGLVIDEYLANKK